MVCLWLCPIACYKSELTLIASLQTEFLCPVVYICRSNWIDDLNRLLGLRFYIGNTYVNGVWFGGFQNASCDELAGAISWEPKAAARDVDGIMNAKFNFEDVSDDYQSCSDITYSKALLCSHSKKNTPNIGF